MVNNIILIGFMGTGKTSVGRRLAEEFRYSFVDTDEEVERVTGLTVAQIFKKYGEKRFRSEETIVLKKLLLKDKQVIATGGGLVLREENQELLRQGGLIICLTADKETIYERVSKRSTRPLLMNGDMRERVDTLLAERQDAYQIADHFVDTTGKSPKAIANEIYEIIRKRPCVE